MISDKIKRYNDLADEMDKLHEEIGELSEKELCNKIDEDRNKLKYFDFRHFNINEDGVTWFGRDDEYKEDIQLEIKIEEME